MANPAIPELLTFTAQIVAAHVAANKTAPNDLPALINDVYGALAGAGSVVEVAPAQEPAVPIKRSVQHEYIVCLEDGAKLKVLTRYLGRFGLTPDTYRAKWGLPRDYPMTAPAYAAKRSAWAKQLGLGTALSPVETPPAAEPERPIETETPTVLAEAEPHLTAASVFANFPGAEVSAEATAAVAGFEKPARKRFAQQSMRVVRKRSDTRPM